MAVGIIKHGHSKRGLTTPEYRAWSGMKNRCLNPKDKKFDLYGGRGIKVCARWDDFALFLEDMGLRPSANHSLDRIDVDGDYEPSNCRWATYSQQCYNKRQTISVEFNGEMMTLDRVAEITGLKLSALRHRVAKGIRLENSHHERTSTERECSVCGAVYATKSAKSVYCSNRCKLRLYAERKRIK